MILEHASLSTLLKVRPLSRQLRLLADKHMCGTICLRAPENALTRGVHIFTLVREADKRPCTISLPAFANYPYVADAPYSRKSQVAEHIRTKAYIEDHLEELEADPTLRFPDGLGAGLTRDMRAAYTLARLLTARPGSGWGQHDEVEWERGLGPWGFTWPMYAAPGASARDDFARTRSDAEVEFAHESALRCLGRVRTLDIMGVPRREWAPILAAARPDTVRIHPHSVGGMLDAVPVAARHVVVGFRVPECNMARGAIKLPAFGEAAKAERLTLVMGLTAHCCHSSVGLQPPFVLPDSLRDVVVVIRCSSNERHCCRDEEDDGQENVDGGEETFGLLSRIVAACIAHPGRVRLTLVGIDQESASALGWHGLETPKELQGALGRSVRDMYHAAQDVGLEVPDRVETVLGAVQLVSWEEWRAEGQGSGTFPSPLA
jgi:hypothetical protein